MLLPRTYAIAAALMFLTCTISCGSADETTPATLSVAQAVAMALDINPNLKQAEVERKTAQSNLRIAGFGTTFDIGSSATIDRPLGNSDLSSLVFGRFSFASPLGTKASLDLSPFGSGSSRGTMALDVRHPVRRGTGALSPKGIALHEASLDASTQDKQLFTTRQTTIQSVIEAYYRAVLAREQVKVQEQAVTNAEDAADGWREREKEGMAAGIDVTRSEIQVAQTKDQLNTQQRVAREALDRLMISIGQGVGQTPELTDSVPSVDEQLPSLKECVDAALSNRVELGIFDNRMEDDRLQIATAKDQFRSGFDLVARFSGNGDDAGLIGSSLFKAGLFTAGVEYTRPLDRRILQERYDTANRNMDVLRNLRDYQAEQITEQVRAAYRSVETARASLEILAQNQKVAQDNIGFAQKMMDEGVGSSRDVLDAQVALTSVESGILSARTDLYLARTNLKYAMGEDLNSK